MKAKKPKTRFCYQCERRIRTTRLERIGGPIVEKFGLVLWQCKDAAKCVERIWCHK